jgi:ABC-2 type transport system permease protein
VWLLARREWGAALDSGVTALAAAGFALLANSIFLNEFFLAARAELGPWFRLLPWLYVAFLPALSMRAWAEERRTKSFETMLSLPFTPLQLVLGKYLCALGVLVCALGSALPLVALLAWVGDPDPGLLAGGFLAAFLLGAQLLALGQAASILTRDQVSAFVLAALFAAVIVLSGHPRLVSVLDGISPAWRLGSALREHLSAWPHYERLARGLVEPAALLYFALTGALALWWTAWAVERVRD